MKHQNPIINELKVLRDEVNLQVHLFSMDAKEQWEALEKRFHVFEQKAERSMQKLGEKSEGFWVGNKDEIDGYKKEYEELKKSQVEGK